MKEIKLIPLVLFFPWILPAIDTGTEHAASVGWYLYDDQYYLPGVGQNFSLNLVYSYRNNSQPSVSYKKYYYGYMGYLQRKTPQKNKTESWFGALAIAYEEKIRFKGISIPAMSYSEIYIYENDPFMSHEPEGYRHNIGGGIYWPVVFSRPSVLGTRFDLRFESRVSCIPVNIPGVFFGRGYPVIFMTHSQLELTHGIFSLLMNHINQYQLWVGNRNYWVVRPLEIMLSVTIKGTK